ncbi:MAG: ABC transporter ATP-binding protein [Gammaproteobacteria bacterium]|nr:ABC transporter ATP-binding protein [Gammaproteobacteria bacterium]MDH3536501.1 ABC transporter ATP-binding protein [Gammaproteobacteria bacterium]
MTEHLLQVSSLNKHFGGIYATDDVNLAVEQGKIHAIIGPNGAGKTTLLAQLSGQIKPDSGDIEFGGKSIIHYSMARRAREGLARSFQITSVVMPMTLLQNVMLAVQGTGGHSFRFWAPVSDDREMRDAAMASLAEVGLDDRADRVAANVSHGEQRQLEVAMALAMKPRMLLLDEPMAGMGKEEGAMMVEILNRLRGDKTILLVEHDMDAVFSLADKLSVLVDGHIIATDTVEAIRNNLEVQRAYLGDSHA